MNVYDRVVPNNAVDTLWVLAIGVVTVYSFDVIIRAMRGYFIDLAGKRADIHLSSLLFEKVLGIRMEARPESVGAFANNLSEFESVRNFITSATITTLIDLPFVVLFVAIIALVGGKLALVPLVGIPLILIYGLFIQLPLRSAVEQSIRGSAEKQATLIESLVGLEAIKSQGAEGAMQRKWEDSVAYISSWSVKARLLSSSVVNAAVFIQQLTTVGVVAFGVYLIGEGELSLGGLIASVILAGRALAPMAQVANIATHYHQAKAALHTLDRLMSLPTERQELHDFVHRSGYFGRVEFDGVSFQYPGQKLDSLKDVTLTIEPGERVAILGPVGSGKSTLEKLIMGLYAPISGSVRIDGIDIRQLDPAELRRNIGYVPQDISLFYGSVRDNIVFGAPYVSDETMLKAAKLAGVSSLVDPHPQGFDMPVGERGERLSGGQRQSIGLARAVLLNPPIMLLDEPTNSMDGTTEEAVIGRLEAYLRGRTVVLVTHRPSLLELVDRIIVLDRGRVVLDGPKNSVLERLNANHRRHSPEYAEQGGTTGSE
jgi:ATP-binding cassette subfamily C protein LapB